MKCPECESKMIEKRWITSHWFGDMIIFEIIWWILLFPLTFFGAIGWSILVLVIVVIAFLSHGKRWYKCKNCGHSMMLVTKKN